MIFRTKPKGIANALPGWYESIGRSTQGTDIQVRSLKIIFFCRALRNTWEGRELSDQLFRSGTRVGANYRSASRARSHPDFVAKIGFVVEKADESVYWLELIRAAEVAKGVELEWLLDESSQLSRIFNQSQLTAKNNATGRRNR